MHKVMPREVAFIEPAHDRLGMTYRQLAEMLGADESTIHRWRTGVSDPSPVFVRQLRELGNLLTELERAFRTPKAARSWLRRRVPQFGNRRPIDLLLAGRLARVTDALVALNAGMSA